eukprot:scaffold340607_cov19-Prasinocladus_malaysianus.AAC.2
MEAAVVLLLAISAEIFDRQVPVVVGESSAHIQMDWHPKLENAVHGTLRSGLIYINIDVCVSIYASVRMDDSAVCRPPRRYPYCWGNVDGLHTD